MANIDSDRMIVQSKQREDNSWLFTVYYTACFCEDDLGQRFDDTVVIQEARGRERVAGCAQATMFTATSSKVFRKKRIVVQDGCIDAVCAMIRLHRVQGRQAVDDEQRTPALEPARRMSA